MMRRVDLLPAAYAERRRQRERVVAIVAAGGVVLLLLFGYWLVLAVQISGAERELAGVQATNRRLEAEIAELQKFADLEAEVQAKQRALQTVMVGDVDWPAILAELALVVPGEVWLTQMNASSGAQEGATAVETETAPIRISAEQPVGRIQFNGSALSMPGVAKWLIRQMSVGEFKAIWLGNATEEEGETSRATVDFESTLELNAKALSRRFQARTA